MLRRLAGVGIAGTLSAVLADRLLGLWRGDRSPDPLRMMVVVDAPVEAVWAAVADVPFQVEWMAEMRDLRLDPPGRARVGQRGEASVRILGVTLPDVVEVAELEPPRRYAIRHLGAFKGHGVFTLDAGADGTTTILRWEETLVPPILPHLGAVLQAPILRAIFQADLERLKRFVEIGAAE